MVIVLDGFGVGQMADVPEVRPQDTGANTWLHILQNTPGLRLPTLEKLGLMNIVDTETAQMKRCLSATYGKATLTTTGPTLFLAIRKLWARGHKSRLASRLKIKST